MAADDQPEVEQRGHVQMVVVSWADLVLDPENPRIEDGGDNSRETLNYLLETETEKQIALARDIASSGALNPLDLIGVISDDDGAYIVVEGNRRIAALKMLKSPELVNDFKLRRRIEKIAESGTGPDEVTCTWFDERDDSRPWILLRHRGEQEGRGVVPWTGEMQERYSRDPGSQADLAIQVRTIMTAAYPTNADIANELDIVFYGGTSTDGRKVRSRPTTLGRLLKSTQVQKAFGFTVENGEIELVAPEPDVHEAFRQMIFDVSEGLTARDINSAYQIQTYIDRYPNLIYVPPPLPSTPGPTPSGGPVGGGSPTPTATGGGASGTTPAPQPQPPTAPTPARRRLPQEEKKIFDKLKLNKFSLRVSKTLTQAQTLHIDHVPAVAGVMVRVIVELCVTEAVTKLNLPGVTESDSLRKKLEAVLTHLDPNIAHSLRRDKALEPAWINSQKTSGDGLGVDLMNAFVHGVTKSAAPSEVRSLSRDYREMLDRLNVEMS